MAQSGVGNAAAGPAVPALPPSSTVPTTHCCVNIYGWGMPTPDGVEGHQPTIIPCEIPASADAWEEAADVILAQGKSPWRSSFCLTEEERAPYRGPYAMTLLVGFALAGLGPEYNEKPPGFESRRAEGDRMNADGFWLDAPTPVENFPARKVVPVVTKLEHNCKARVMLYALLRPADPKTSLCRMYRVRVEQCFYLPLFRYFDKPNIKGRKGRSISWNSRVRKQRVMPKEMQLEFYRPWDAKPGGSKESMEPMDGVEGVEGVGGAEGGEETEGSSQPGGHSVPQLPLFPGLL